MLQPAPSTMFIFHLYNCTLAGGAAAKWRCYKNATGALMTSFRPKHSFKARRFIIDEAQRAVLQCGDASDMWLHFNSSALQFSCWWKTCLIWTAVNMEQDCRCLLANFVSLWKCLYWKSLVFVLRGIYDLHVLCHTTSRGKYAHISYLSKSTSKTPWGERRPHKVA